MGRGSRTGGTITAEQTTVGVADDIRRALRRPVAGRPNIWHLELEVRGHQNPADAIPVLQRAGSRLLTDHSPVADGFLARVRNIYDGRSLDSQAAIAMITLGGEPMDTDAVVSESARLPHAVLHLRGADGRTRCGRDIVPGWGKQTRRTTWANEPERHCAACAPHAGDEPACQETQVDVLDSAEKSLLAAAARRGLVAGLAAEPPAIDNEPAARLRRASNAAVRETLIDLACERASRHPRMAMEMLLAPADRDRLVVAYGSIDAVPDPDADQLRAAQEQMLSRGLSPYEDDYANASKTLANALIAAREPVAV